MLLIATSVFLSLCPLQDRKSCHALLRSNNPTSMPYCHKDLYLSAFSAVTSGHIHPGNPVHLTISASTAESLSTQCQIQGARSLWTVPTLKATIYWTVFNRRQLWISANRLNFARKATFLCCLEVKLNWTLSPSSS